ncbi:MAG: ABC transporter permease [Bacteroidota bacterium]|nr:ABC transporter permease [Bacteroidota bacterium]
MGSYFKIAWRNIWRNKRRSIITISSILFALFFALIMRAFQLGSYNNMVSNIVEAYTGYIQIHTDSYWEDKSINKALTYNNDILKKIQNTSGVKNAIPRLENFCLVSTGNTTKGAMVTGIDPELENSMTNLSEKLIKGEMLKSDDRAVIVAEQLAKFLNIDINDTIVLLGQGYHGVSAYDKLPVKGIIHFPSPELDNLMIYMPLKNAQYMFSCQNKITSISVNIDDLNDLKKISATIKNNLDTKTYEVMTWDELLPVLDQQIKSDSAGGIIMLLILYMIIGFGVFGTVMMMITERKREFAVMIAVGMSRFKLIFILFIEMIYIGLLGILSGITVSIPIILLGYYNPIPITGEMGQSLIDFGLEPIMPIAWKLGYFINQSISVAVIILIAIVFPIGSILKLNINNALKG